MNPTRMTPERMAAALRLANKIRMDTTADAGLLADALLERDADLAHMKAREESTNTKETPDT